MLNKLPIHKILFLDIETVPQHEYWNQVDQETQYHWIEKTKWQRKEEEDPGEFYENRAGILAEFGQIVCISCGIITPHNTFRVKSFYGTEEAILLNEFVEMMETRFANDTYILCAHNGKEFDFPYLARRMIINQIKIPTLLQIQGKKPWEIPHLDTLELWKFGDYKHFTSVKLLAHVLGIPTPKDDIDGSQVANVFYKDKDLERIRIYCEKDTLTVAQIIRKMRFEPLVTME